MGILYIIRLVSYPGHGGEENFSTLNIAHHQVYLLSSDDVPSVHLMLSSIHDSHEPSGLEQCPKDVTVDVKMEPHCLEMVSPSILLPLFMHLVQGDSH